MKRKQHEVQRVNGNSQAATPRELMVDLRRMIEEARRSVAATVNAGLTMLYWRIGRRIREEILQGKRAEYGKKIVVSLSRQLVTDLRENENDMLSQRSENCIRLYQT